MRKKILFFNWTPFDNPQNAGGGITIYIKNVIQNIDTSKYDVYFLSAGEKYNPFRLKPYLRKSKNIFAEKCKSFEVINAESFAPMGISSWKLNHYAKSKKEDLLIEKFNKKFGPFDIVHITNIASVFPSLIKLKEKNPHTKLIFDIHNYNFCCLNSLLFRHDINTLCTDYCNGKNCLHCFKNDIHSKKIFLNRIKIYLDSNKFLKPFTKKLLKFRFFYQFRYKKYYLDNKNKISTCDDFVNYRNTNISLINKYADHILAVSKRVSEIGIAYGLKKEKIKVSYIGTSFSENTKKRELTDTSKFTIAYFGYARISKGYFFLIKELSKLPPDITKNINLIFCAKNSKPADIKHLSNFNSIQLYNGYTHNDMLSRLTNVNLGIVPVLWEDNLPQVAIELTSMGVPILCSNLGGASELSNSKHFIFNPNTENDFNKKLLDIINNKSLLDEYWKEFNGLTSIQENLNHLYQLYEGEYVKN